MFFLINKPIGFTSFDVIRKLRGMTGIRKMWHTGTLDPLATGALLIATDNSTKLISRLELESKTYLFTVDIALSSPSLDMEWDIETVDISNIENHTHAELKEFLENQITQIPPKYSAIHIDGKRAYELVRKWKQFDIPERPISVSRVEIVDISLPQITIRLTISAGGYIRSFAPIIAEFYGVPSGGCITALHREKIGNIDLARSMGFDNLDITNTIPYWDLLSHIPSYELDISYRKPLIDGLIINTGTSSERVSWSEILISCGDLTSLGKWTPWGIEVIRNYV
jgi:tRNA pseudouridine55 synthase